MYRLISSVTRVIRQQFHGAGWKGSTKDEVRKSKDGLVVYSQPSDDLILKNSYSSFSGDSHYGTETKQRRWYDARDDYSWYMHHSHSSFEALGWGAAVVLGLHFRPLARSLFDDRDNHVVLCPSVLLALGAPPAPQLTETQELSDIDKLLGKFTRVYEDYRAEQENAVGAAHATHGDYTRAVVHWKRASVGGNSAAQYNLGLCHEQGLGVRRDHRKATQFYEMSAASNHPRATYNLAVMYMRGQGETTVSREKGEATESLKQGEAMTLMKHASELGVAEARTYLGVYYTQAPHRDMARAVSLFTLASAQNNTEAEYMLGVCCERGWGTTQNECRATDLYNRASIAGHAAATYNLAVLHEVGGGGLPENREAAKDLYDKAVDQGCDVAQDALDRLAEEDEISSQTDLFPEPTNNNERTSLHSSRSSPLLGSRGNNSLDSNKKLSQNGHIKHYERSQNKPNIYKSRADNGTEGEKNVDASGVTKRGDRKIVMLTSDDVKLTRAVSPSYLSNRMLVQS